MPFDITKLLPPTLTPWAGINGALHQRTYKWHRPHWYSFCKHEAFTLYVEDPFPTDPMGGAASVFQRWTSKDSVDELLLMTSKCLVCGKVLLEGRLKKPDGSETSKGILYVLSKDKFTPPPKNIPDTRAILELLYFASGIAIAVAAVMALSQIRLTKQIAKANSRRESVKLAADLCRYFAEFVVPAWVLSNSEYVKNGFQFLKVSTAPGQAPFVLKDGEIIAQNFDTKRLAEELPKAGSVVPYLNCLESFSIPFAAGVADEDIGYRETARPFCQGAQAYMPVIFQLRALNSGRFESTVKLYGTWNNRLVAELSEPALKAMQEIVSTAARDRIKPLD